jgi:hypothetical protein
MAIEINVTSHKKLLQTKQDLQLVKTLTNSNVSQKRLETGNTENLDGQTLPDTLNKPSKLKIRIKEHKSSLDRVVERSKSPDT